MAQANSRPYNDMYRLVTKGFFYTYHKGDDRTTPAVRQRLYDELSHLIAEPQRSGLDAMMLQSIHIVHEELKDIINAEANSIATATPYKAKYSDAFRAALEFLVSTPGLLAIMRAVEKQASEPEEDKVEVEAADGTEMNTAQLQAALDKERAAHCRAVIQADENEKMLRSVLDEYDIKLCAGNGRQRALAAVAKQDAECAHKRLKLEKQYRNDAENDLAAAEASNRAIRHGLAVALRGVAIALEQ